MTTPFGYRPSTAYKAPDSIELLDGAPVKSERIPDEASVFYAEDKQLRTDTSVGTLPPTKKIKTEGGVQEVVCMKLKRFPPGDNTGTQGFEVKHLRYQKSGAAKIINFSIVTLTSKVIRLAAARTATVEEMKSLIQYKEGTPLCQQRLIYKGLELPDGMPIGHYIHDNDTEARVHLVLRLRGC
ncbi:hypothetical protein A1Q2_06806 [Trichosporon asahii var. asahii CBS 8904]|uniref:Ubiquitin-like domain-containing protein n=1 Tax=Trichosporon asahii var. asahii (strain CBS 8904) TaxID=1220162 RepID=K1VDD4_TRIAC|nr:hypothetical protein A1Q2_06806 [Trichosporon asahii var. asahii CBS 8904]